MSLIREFKDQIFLFLKKIHTSISLLTGKSKLNQDTQDLLDLMKKDNLNTGIPFEASFMWKEINKKFQKNMHLNGISNVEVQEYNTRFAQSITNSYRYYRYSMWMLYCKIKEKDTFNVLDKVQSPLPNKSRFVNFFDKHKLSWDILLSIDNLYSIYESYPSIFTDPVVVVDLGAGWGRIGYVLKKINPKCTYIVIDLPESLILSQSRLPQLLSDETVLKYQEIRGIPLISKDILKKKGLCFCGTHDLKRFEDYSIDVFINLQSFQEMTEEQVNAYFHYINKKVKGVFFTSQYWYYPELYQKYNVIEKYEDYPFFESWKQEYLHTSNYTSRYFETLFYVNETRD